MVQVKRSRIKFWHANCEFPRSAVTLVSNSSLHLISRAILGGKEAAARNVFLGKVDGSQTIFPDSVKHFGREHGSCSGYRDRQKFENYAYGVSVVRYRRPLFVQVHLHTHNCHFHVSRNCKKSLTKCPESSWKAPKNWLPPFFTGERQNCVTKTCWENAFWSPGNKKCSLLHCSFSFLRGTVWIKMFLFKMHRLPLFKNFIAILFP